MIKNNTRDQAGISKSFYMLKKLIPAVAAKVDKEKTNLSDVINMLLEKWVKD